MDDVSTVGSNRAIDRQEKWDLRFLRLACEISSWSKDPSTKVGAVLTRDTNRIVSQGYNGFEEYDEDKEEDYLDRDIKYSKIIHAEINCLNRSDTGVSHCTLYTYPFSPCSECAKIIAKRGISRVVSLVPSKDILSRWEDSIRMSNQILILSDIEVKLYKSEDLCLK